MRDTVPDITIETFPLLICIKLSKKVTLGCENSRPTVNGAGYEIQHSSNQGLGSTLMPIRIDNHRRTKDFYKTPKCSFSNEEGGNPATDDLCVDEFDRSAAVVVDSQTWDVKTDRS